MIDARWKQCPDGHVLDITVRDDGPGFDYVIAAGGSLDLLSKTLEVSSGGLEIGAHEGGGTVVHAWWLAEQENHA